jgi:hypothetical protein
VIAREFEELLMDPFTTSIVEFDSSQYKSIGRVIL